MLCARFFIIILKSSAEKRQQHAAPFMPNKTQHLISDKAERTAEQHRVQRSLHPTATPEPTPGASAGPRGFACSAPQLPTPIAGKGSDPQPVPASCRLAAAGLQHHGEPDSLCGLAADWTSTTTSQQRKQSSAWGFQEIWFPLPQNFSSKPLWAPCHFKAERLRCSISHF